MIGLITYDVLGTPSRGRHSNPNGQLIGLLALIASCDVADTSVVEVDRPQMGAPSGAVLFAGT